MGAGTDYALLRPDNTYGRDENDTVRQAEAVIRALEGAAATRLFPSGMAAIAALFRTVPNGGRIVMQSGIYWGTVKWAREFCARRGIALDEVEAADPVLLSEALEAKGRSGLDRGALEPLVEAGGYRAGGRTGPRGGGRFWLWMPRPRPRC